VPYEEVQRNFINDHANDDPEDEQVKFTALDITNYIETECLSKSFSKHSERHQQNGKI
jgi:hypothetical protein